MKSNKKQTAGLAIVGNVDSASTFIKMLKEEHAKLVEKFSAPPKVAGSITVGGNTVDITTETNISKLIGIVGMLQVGEKAYNEAAEGVLKGSLNGTFPVFKVNGYTVEAIVGDINHRIELISFTERKKELETLMQKGEKFLSEKEQFNMFLEEVAAKFGQKV